MMLKDRSNINFGRKRLREIREKRRPSVADSIRNSQTTVTINIAIEVISGILFMIGLVYAIRFLNMRREYMEPVHHSILFWSITAIGCGWFGWLVLRMRRNIQRLFYLREEADRELAKIAGDNEDE